MSAQWRDSGLRSCRSSPLSSPGCAGSSAIRCAQLFAGELAALPAERARAALVAIDVLTSYESYQLLRNDQALSRADASTILVDSLTTLLAAPSPTDPEVDR